MKLYRIHPAPNVPYIGTVACDGPAEHALKLARKNPWYGQQMTDASVAVETTELWKEGI